MAGSSSNQLRSAFVEEITSGTIPTSPAFKTSHSPFLFESGVERIHQPSITAGGAYVGDAVQAKMSKGKIESMFVYNLYDQMFETLFQSAWVADVMKDGKARKTVTIENSIEAGIGGTRNYLRHVGVEAVGGSVSANARKEVRFSLDLLGMQSKDAVTTALSGATYADPGNEDPFTSNTDLGVITLAGYTLDAIESLEINFNYEGRDPQPQLSSDNLAGVTRGAFRPQIKMRLYLDTNFKALFDVSRANEQTAAKFTANFGSVTGKKYKFEFHKCNVDIAKAAFDQPSAFHEVTLTARYSAAESCVMTLTRAIA
jgi:hypothetical protein